jgi:hypothetical protein
MSATPKGDRLRAADRKRTATYARHLGIPPGGLEALAKAISTGRRINGINGPALAAKGLVDPVATPGGWPEYSVNKAGCELLRRARTLGW